jgi:hypothetical protein
MYEIKITLIYGDIFHSKLKYDTFESADEALNQMVQDGVYLDDFDESDVLEAEVVETEE